MPSKRSDDPDHIDNAPEAHLAALGARFLAALEARANRQVDAALEGFAAVLAAEPRLAEPRIELGAIYLDMNRFEEAEAHAREAIRILENGGQWTEDVPENVLLGMAWALLGASLQAQAQSDEVVFGEDPARFKELVAQAAMAFARAAELDPTDIASGASAAELGEEGDDDGGQEM